jgi:hypothetical protein
MAKAVDKVILTNAGALKKKYGAQGMRDVQSAVSALIQADKARGLQTRLIAVDDPAVMGSLSAPVVADSGDPKQNKAAIDAVYKALAPDYLMILGSIDVIPHQDLKNPLYDGPNGDDPDEFAYGDLPYACEAPYSQQPQDFVGPTRVVGRLPDITGDTDAAYLTNLLKVAAGYKAADHQSFMSYFAVTAEIWQASTQLSVTNTFGDAKELQDVPPRNYKWKPTLLNRLAHFFNCHGADQSSQFYGQPASGKKDFPPAMDAAYVNGKIREGAVAAAECCYGGQLYALSSVVPQIGICNVYLANKGYGFFASTTIAYGPAEGNGQADLICQYFMRGVASGASLGRAALQARQQFVKTASPPDPSDIKTLAQFNLYGDPSITPVAVTQVDVAPIADKGKGKSKGKAMFDAERVERKDRRRQLFKQGTHIAESEPVPRRSRARAPQGIIKNLRAKARGLGWRDGALLSFTLSHPAGSKSKLPKALASDPGLPTAYHVLFKKRSEAERKKSDKSGPNVRSLVALIGKEVGGKLASVSEIHSR